MWADLREEYAGLIEFHEVDRESDDGSEFARSHNIFYQPVFIIYEGDTLVSQEAGVSTAAALRAFVASALEEGS